MPGTYCITAHRPVSEASDKAKPHETAAPLRRRASAVARAVLALDLPQALVGAALVEDGHVQQHLLQPCRRLVGLFMQLRKVPQWLRTQADLVGASWDPAYGWSALGPSPPSLLTSSG
jgi:hypothetical protein